jgi:hypothetical protein
VLAEKLIRVSEVVDLPVRVKVHNQGAVFDSCGTVNPTNNSRGLLVAAQTVNEGLRDLALGIAVGREQRGYGEQVRHLLTLAAVPTVGLARRETPDASRASVKMRSVSSLPGLRC